MSAWSSCRSCGAPIIWARTEQTKTMPLNAAPDLEGAFSLEQEFGEPMPLARWLGPDPMKLRYSSHYATCPNADEHRRRRRSVA